MHFIEILLQEKSIEAMKDEGEHVQECESNSVTFLTYLIWVVIDIKDN